MRCLYCGKELALLKRWTGGGEFCSDAHRQQYQEEYNQLALTRLLQAKPQSPNNDPGQDPGQSPGNGSGNGSGKNGDAEPGRGKAPAREAQPVSAKSAGRSNGSTQSVPQPVLQPVMQEAATKQAPMSAMAPAVAVEQEPEPIVESHSIMETIPEPEIVSEIVPEIDRDPAPAEMSSFLIEIPVPAYSDVMVMSRPETEFAYASATELPRRERFEEWATQLVACGPVEISRFGTTDSAPRMNHERRVEIRDFVRSTPIVEVELKQAGETVVPAMIDEPLEVATVSYPPQENPELWTEGWREFAFEQSLGALARATFRTTGMQDNEDASDPIPEESELESMPVAAAAGVEEAPNALPDGRASKDAVEAVKVEDAVEAVKVEEPVKIEEPVKVEEPVKIEEPVKVDEPVKEETTGPSVATTPLPMTLHGLAAGRGKPVQVFTAVASAIDVHVPRSNALPLRPVMTLGPAPAIAKGLEKAAEKTPEKTIVVKVDPKKTQAKPEIKPDPRQVNGKAKKEAVPEKPVKKEAAKEEVKPAAKPELKVEPKVDAKPESKTEPKLDIKLQPKPESSIWKDPTDKLGIAEQEPAVVKHAKLQHMPAPLAVPYTTPDLGLPSLNLDTSGGFWKRLPIAGKLMLLVTVVGLALGVMYIIKSAGGPTAATGPQVVATALPDDGEWILDWGSEPGVRRTHDLYIRKSSLTLSDYRIEFKEQLESKALGWVYRAKDSKNFYVARVEAAKPGVDTNFALVHWAVVDGQEQTHVQTPLSLTPAVHLDTVFKIKFDAIGDHFTTWVQDQKVDEWSDSRFKVGGAGLYNEHGAKPVSLNLSLLVVKK